ncbi:MAG: pyridoxal phosphate-dependent aminotransferase [Candidatus Bipolaricaulis sp.]|nr:pyridoxal phosphate-dependent aminotransferase [Candidatus Bipolaricaulis sp.]
MKALLSERARTLPYSGIREIFDLAGSMEGVIHLEIGEPDFDTPRSIVDSSFRAAAVGMTHYTSSAGVPELRARIAGGLTRELGVSFDPADIVVTAGGMEALLLAMLVALDPGDEVIVPSPAWPNYEAHILLSGGVMRRVPLEESRGFELDPAAVRDAVSARTKLLILNSPHNPTGAVLGDAGLRAIADLAKEHDLYVFSDEAYASLTFDGHPFHSIASLEGMQERTVILRTFSKTHAMTGWRVGFLAGPRPLAEKAARFHEHTSACTSSISQAAALASFDVPRATTEKMVREYERRRDLLVAGLSRIPGLRVPKTGGAFYLFVAVDAFGMPTLELAKRLLVEERVAVAPGTAFGPEGEGYLRLCFANSEKNLQDAIRRMEAFFSRIGASARG